MSKTIELTNPIKTPRSYIKSITFREPRFEDYMEIGDPRLVVRTGDKFYFQDIDPALKAYIEALADIDPNLLPQLSLADTLKAKKAVLDFFGEAEVPTSPDISDARPMNSSSLQDGTQETSTE